jgi:3-oxoacyl-[acyl-carrier-protein] synthase-3
MKTIIENIKVAAITSYLPINELELASLGNLYGEKEVSSIIKTTGIERVRIAGDNQTSSDMCFEAAQLLIENEKIDRQEIGGLVFVSQTSDYILPATSIILQDRLGLSTETVCLDVHYGCSGYVYGIFQAALWISSGACDKVLVLAGDTSSKMINPKDKSLKMVFGDCGTATLVTKGDARFGFSLCSDGAGHDRLIIPAGGYRKPISCLTKELKCDAENNCRTAEDLYMDGMAIFGFAITNVHKNINSLIEQMDWIKSDVNLYALHQANHFMVNYIRKKLKVEVDKVPINVCNYGNTGPATIPLLLSDLYSIEPINLEKVILCGFGVGLSWGSVACNLNDTHFYTPINK